MNGTEKTSLFHNVDAIRAYVEWKSGCLSFTPKLGALRETGKTCDEF